MRILTTFPGKFGDILWALPTVRAISEGAGKPVDFLTSKQYGTPEFLDLLQQQGYIQHVYTDPDWIVEHSAPMQPVQPPRFAALSPSDFTRMALPHLPEQTYDQVIHLGYPSWPEAPLPSYTYKVGQLAFPGIAQLDLARPWVEVQDPYSPTELVVGFSDEHFELKVGITVLLDRDAMLVVAPHNSRWGFERPVGMYPLRCCDWVEAAGIIRSSGLFFGCCSALHVLACALGKRCVIMEPNEHRWNSIFWPYGQDDFRVTLVKGNDGRPTFDSRHCADTIAKVLQEAHV